MDFMGGIRGTRVNSEGLSNFLCEEHNHSKKVYSPKDTPG
jgi:hypothetical protein